MKIPGDQLADYSMMLRSLLAYGFVGRTSVCAKNAKVVCLGVGVGIASFGPVPPAPIITHGVNKRGRGGGHLCQTTQQMLWTLNWTQINLEEETRRWGKLIGHSASYLIAIYTWCEQRGRGATPPNYTAHAVDLGYR